MSITWEATARNRARLAAEKGAIVKDWGGRLPIALVYPNTYAVGMSSLGFQIIYGLLNAELDLVCERAFYEGARGVSPGPATILSLESQRPLGDFAALAFSVNYELDYSHIVAVLRDAGLPLLAAARDERHPLVLGGGPCLTANPEPVAPFFDAIVIGEAEPVLPAILNVLRAGDDRTATLRALAAIPGVYVPAFYTPVYATGGHLLAVTAREGAPSLVRRAVQKDLDATPGASVVVSKDTELANMHLVEVARGCARGCLFCLAGFCFLPARERSPERVVAMAKEGLARTRRIGLVGAAVSDYSHFLPVLKELRALGAQVGVSSLRVDAFHEEVARVLAASGARTATLGVEAGSQRLRDLVHKGITDDQVEQAADVAGKAGFTQVKLYYMIGLPGETDADVDALVGLTLRVAERLERARRGGRVVVALTPCVPKAQTPFQWMAMAPAGAIEEGLARVRAGLRPRRVEVRAESPEWAAVEGVLARGDRRLAAVLAGMERPTLAAWARGLAEAGLNADFYLRRTRPVDEVLPWAVLDTGVRPSALVSLGEKARRAIERLAPGS